MFSKLAVAAVLVGLSVGSVAYGWTDVEAVGWRQDRANGFTEDGIPWENLTGPVQTIEEHPGGDFFDVYSPQGLTDIGGGLYDSRTGDRFFDVFFDVFMEKPIVDDGDPGYVEWDSMRIILDFDSCR